VDAPKWHVRLYGAGLLSELDMLPNLPVRGDLYLIEGCIGGGAMWGSTGLIGEEYPWVTEDLDQVIDLDLGMVVGLSYTSMIFVH